MEILVLAIKLGTLLLVTYGGALCICIARAGDRGAGAEAFVALKKAA